MKRSVLLGSALAAALMVATPATGEITFGEDGLTGDFGKVQLRGRFGASVQGAVFDPVEDPNAGTETDAEIDGSARLSLEYTADNAWVFGAIADIDTAQEQVEAFERDEFYVYAASQFGRVEVGENDGPADTLSFHAARVGLGQVRGVSARYTGTVALLSPFDSQDAAKITYLSPPIEGLRFGVAYAPEFEINADDPNPSRRTIQEDVIEFGAQYVQPVGEFVLGGSAAYVAGSSDPVTGREDIESWSVGVEARRGKLTAAAAFVDRGRSNLLPTSDTESEWNAGVSWREEGWAVAASVAIGDENGGTVSRSGVGGEYDITTNIHVAADAVLLNTEDAFGNSEDGAVGLVEVGLRF
ncbi:MAG: porin [Pseudomonadota bacterium]